MIQGLKLDFTTEQLDTHLAKRIAHHTERRQFYETQAETLRKGGVVSQAYTGGDPTRALEESGKQHASKADLFQVMRDHLVPNEVYRLEDGDLEKLEIIPRRW